MRFFYNNHPLRFIIQDCIVKYRGVMSIPGLRSLMSYEMHYYLSYGSIVKHLFGSCDLSKSFQIRKAGTRSRPLSVTTRPGCATGNRCGSDSISCFYRKIFSEQNITRCVDVFFHISDWLRSVDVD